MMSTTRIAIDTDSKGLGLLKGEMLGSGDLFSTLCLAAFGLIVCLVLVASFTRAVSLLWRERTANSRHQTPASNSEHGAKSPLSKARPV